ncbi:3-hydroxyacyl-ACP dehydratase FabZ [Parvibaculum sp.]|jgi:3-hydroxyacyl-[acyl-carrier-protein] dehydratase|uniref:3-hydroxyacyl-ACP dehydratase FabZ n=1 Tax=Parvibaculum sp. TaxID=2024848 RepID=UPI001B0AADEA|nr:3-hydroxyacyl-ACP dehydratase FabZ [Parvibaculum sp.]MBO6680349.1 3-hydroxyacyl-ACP dehydratase FabZ [Parvibaculum sp.]MBO6686335.1 3-hydroxyacyl-ACP dehydratase FabZ [Parvibaculum sp.]
MSEAETPAKLDSADINRVLELLPHRYPMLMIDRIIEMKGDESAIGIKNVTNNEPFFQGHFPGHPVMPGVLIVEAMAQTAGALVINSLGTSGSNQLVYFMTVDRARFRKPVLPGDVLHVHVTKLQSRGTVWKYHGEGRVDGKLVAECDLGAMIAGPAER